MTFTSPPGTPYHRLARTAGHRWWRHLLALATVAAGWIFLALLVYGVPTVFAAVAGRPDGARGLPSFGPRADLAVDFLAVATLLPVVLVAAYVQRRRPGTLSSATGRLRLGWLLRCLPVALAAIVVALGGGFALAVATDPGGAGDLGPDAAWAGLASFAASTAVLFLVVPVQAAAEEYGFRGFLLQTGGAFTRRAWLPILVQAVAFAALHGLGTPWGFADLVVFGVLAGWLTVRTGGLEAAIALHVVNNLCSAGVAAAFGMLTVDETAADAPWQFVAVDVPVLVAFTLVISWMAKRRGIAAAAPAGPAPAFAAPAGNGWYPAPAAPAGNGWYPAPPQPHPGGHPAGAQFGALPGAGRPAHHHPQHVPEPLDRR